MSPIIVAAIAFGVTLGLVVPVRSVLTRFNVLDQPNHRSLHESPRVRGAGIAVLLGFVVAMAVSGELGWTPVIAGLIVGALPMGLLGFSDDVFDLPQTLRLVVQIAVLGAAGVAIASAGSLGGWRWVVAAVIAAGAAIVFTNFFNFMDGINGISVATAAIAGLTLAVISWDAGHADIAVAGAAMAGAVVGFAPFNAWSGAVFLGDVGSYFLGSAIALLTAAALIEGLSPFIVLAPSVLYCVDATGTIVRRWRRGENLLEAHREHVYQRLVRSGWTHRQTALLVVVLSGLICAVGVGAEATGGTVLGIAVAAVGWSALSAGYVALPARVAAVPS